MYSENNITKLSNREKDVLQLIAKEMTTSEIATVLDISFGTVESHRKNLRAKLQAKNLAGIIIRAIKSGDLQITEM